MCIQVDEQLALLQREKVDLLKRLEEDQEDLNELMKKHKALIAQVLLWIWFTPHLSSCIKHLFNPPKKLICVLLFPGFSPPVIFLRSESFKLNWRR